MRARGIAAPITEADIASTVPVPITNASSVPPPVPQWDVVALASPPRLKEPFVTEMSNTGDIELEVAEQAACSSTAAAGGSAFDQAVAVDSLHDVIRADRVALNRCAGVNGTDTMH